MLLGDLISCFNDETTALEVLLGMDDLSLVARVKSAAQTEKIAVGAWTCKAVGHFVAFADDAQWLGLIATSTNAADPGSAALRRMIESTLTAAAEETPAD